jgi:type I restriction enzyme M protein
MLTGEIRSQVDKIWDAFWSGGISNPLEVMEQITYLLFLRRLDDLQTLEENKASRTKKPIERRIFPEGLDDQKRPYEELRWSRFKDFAPQAMFDVVNDRVFPFLRTGMAAEGSTFAHHMKDARFTIPTPALLTKIVICDPASGTWIFGGGGGVFARSASGDFSGGEVEGTFPQRDVPWV